jgi:hypothetical protein
MPATFCANGKRAACDGRWANGRRMVSSDERAAWCWAVPAQAYSVRDLRVYRIRNFLFVFTFSISIGVEAIELLFEHSKGIVEALVEMCGRNVFNQDANTMCRYIAEILGFLCSIGMYCITLYSRLGRSAKSKVIPFCRCIDILIVVKLFR